MSRKTIIWLSGCLLAAVAAYATYTTYADKKAHSNTYFFGSDESVTLRFHYMLYACGDCYPQWNADSVIAGPENSSAFIGKDMNIYYQEKELEDQLSESEQVCMICLEFYVTGKVMKTPSGKYKFMAEKYHRTMRPDCCDNQE